MVLRVVRFVGFFGIFEWVVNQWVLSSGICFVLKRRSSVLVVICDGLTVVEMCCVVFSHVCGVVMCGLVTFAFARADRVSGLVYSVG